MHYHLENRECDYIDSRVYLKHDEKIINKLSAIIWKGCDYPFRDYEICSRYGLVRHKRKNIYPKTQNNQVLINGYNVPLDKLIVNTFYKIKTTNYKIIHVDMDDTNNDVNNLRIVHESMPFDITKSKYENKEWRKSQTWYINGKHNECEKYQISMIEKYIGEPLKKTRYRMDSFTNELTENGDGAFRYSETFDGIHILRDKKVLYNLKFVCDGSQRRTLRESYMFILCQLKYVKKYPDENIMFINIFDGDCCYKYNKQFQKLIEEHETTKVLFCDMFTYLTFINDI